MSASDLPLVLAGPILRRVTPERLTLWLAVREAARVRIELSCGEPEDRSFTLEPGNGECRHLVVGTHLHYLLIDLPFATSLPQDRWIGYKLSLQTPAQENSEWQGWSEWGPDLCYPGKSSPGFVLPSRIGAVLHGSCRKPHYDGGDGLVQVDHLLERLIAGDAKQEAPDSEALPAWPSALVMSGDQVYADDVAGPMLRAIHRLIERLGLPEEPLPWWRETGLKDASELYSHPASYYRRETLLPRAERYKNVLKVLFTGVEKPVFTTDSAHNHLITLAEVLVMYLLVWSPAPWRGLELDAPPGLSAEEQALYARELAAIETFVAGLPAVRRVFAHLPVAMMFDDHDITDDWNLSRQWEETAYGNPFSRRIVGNAIVGYLLNQGWGNRPEAFAHVLEPVRDALVSPGSKAHDDVITGLLRFEAWHYDWPTAPPLVVIDTRTRRWRSEASADRPSGLMDWEALTDLQQAMLGKPAVLLVSPAPIFGVKVIETIQRIFTWFGRPLMVDAENWMSHPGAGEAILNIFRHPKTPRHFVVLSGDVHYSFVYDVELRGRVRGPDIWQVCNSGLRNEFPPRLLDWLDRANRWLYSPRSPLNWLTRRRHMRVIPRKPEGTPAGRRLLNGSGIGLVELDAEGVPSRIRALLADGRWVTFTPREAESRWD